MTVSAGHRIFTTTLASVYPLYLAKVEKKGRTKDELDAVIRWLTGYDQSELDQVSPPARPSRTSSPGRT